MEEKPLRYNTDIPTEHYYKYREKKEIKEGDFYYGKDSDMLYKTWIAMKRGAIVGACTGLTMSTYQPKGYALGPAFEKAFKHGMPPLIAGTTFGVIMSLSANIRHKEDAVNHAIGGYAAGTMLGAWYKSQKAGFWSGVFLAIAASAFKKMSEYGVFQRSLVARRERVFDFYRTGWMIDRPNQEGVEDWDKNDAIKHYSP